MMRQRGEVFSSFVERKPIWNSREVLRLRKRFRSADLFSGVPGSMSFPRIMPFVGNHDGIHPTQEQQPSEMADSGKEEHNALTDQEAAAHVLDVVEPG